MKRILCSLIVCLFSMTYSLNAQQQSAILLENVSSSGVQQMFYRQSMVIAADKKIYVCGTTINSNGDYDILLSKFGHPVDTLLWSVTYSGSFGGDDYAAKVVMDSGGNPIVVGTTQVGSTNYDAIVIKYNSSGIQQWVSTYAGAANGPDGFTSVAVNGTDIYAAGGAVVSALQLTDVLCVKYNSSGTQQWANTWNNGSYNLQDGAARVSYTSGEVRIVAATQEGISPVLWKVASITYNTSGTLVSSGLSGGTTSAFSEVKSVLVDGNNTYVCGTKVVSGQGKNIHVVKYNSSLAEVWSYTKNGSAGLDDEGMEIKLSGSSVLITGYTSISNQGKNVFAAKLAQSNGAVSWENHYDMEGGDSEGIAMEFVGTTTIIPSNTMIVCGTTDRGGTKDILMLHIDHGSGAAKAMNYYNSGVNQNDYARNMAIDPDTKELYVSAQVQVNDSTYESRMLKWRATTIYTPAPTDGYSSYGGYVWNRGQLRATDSTSNEKVAFYNQANSIATYIDDDKISYQLLLANDTTNQDTMYRVDMAFIAGKGGAKVYPYNERKEYINYYLGHMDKPSVRTPLSNVILKQDVYDFTDVLFTSSPTGFRHWLIARTGATPASYQMGFAGQTGLSVDSLGNLLIATTIGNITYKKAKAYSMNTTTGALTLLGWQPSYSISGSTVSFTSIGAWSGVLVLQVDEKEPPMAGVVPESEKNMDWSTFFGGAGRDRNYGVDSDNDGNVWYCGSAWSPINLDHLGEDPLHDGGYDDACIVHFDSECRAKWITVYGGQFHDYAYGIAIDTSGNSYCVGVTSSTMDNFNSDGIDDNTLGGGADGFFLKFNIDGEILVDSYIGGDGNDLAYSVAYRQGSSSIPAGVFIVGSASSGTGFPLQYSSNTDGYDQAYSGGNEGFLMELSPSGELLWSTFLGSSGDDVIYDIADVGGLMTMVGYTTANNYTTDDVCTTPTDGKFPFCPNNWHQEEFSGIKYFLAQFNKGRELIHSTFFGNASVSITGSDPQFFSPTIATYRKEYNAEEKHFFYIAAASDTDNSDNVPFNDWVGSDYPDPYYSDLTNYNNTYRYRWIAKLYTEGQATSFVGGTLINWNQLVTGGNINIIAIAADKYNGLIVTGGGNYIQLQDSDFCENPDEGDFPICDAGGQLYLEDNLTQNGARAFIIHFDAQMNIVWSTLFGTGNHQLHNQVNMNYCISSSGDYIFTGGTAVRYTLWDYDDGSNEDYYRPINNDSDASVTRFSLPQSVIVSNEEIKRKEQMGLHIFPNPTLQYISIALPSFANVSDIIEVYDLQGKLIQSSKTGKRSGTLTLDVGKLSAGMYIIKYTGSSKLLTQSFIKE